MLNFKAKRLNLYPFYESFRDVQCVQIISEIYLLNIWWPGLDQEIQGGGDKSQTNVLDNLGLTRWHCDRAFL